MKTYDVAAYIWPAFHYEPRLEHFWPEKDGEWYTVRRGTPRFPEHDMPKIPLLGYQDEADPGVMRQHVELASEHAINTFIMDWYWFDNAPCLERQLNEGLMPALEGTDTKFYLMWANHDANTMWDMHNAEKELLWTGRVDRAQLEPMFDRVIDRYLTSDNYYCIDGKPVFCIYSFANFMAGLGGIGPATEALTWMRKRCIDKGLPGLHLQGIAFKGGGGVEAAAMLDKGSGLTTARKLGFDSSTSYQFVHDSIGHGDYVQFAQKAMACWPQIEEALGTYFPHVSVGWDNTQRNPNGDKAVTGSTPHAFEACLWKAKQWLDARPNQHPLVTINSWNEWTESSYLLPDMRWGYSFLRAVKEVFG